MKTSGVPFRESLDALIALQAEGKVRHIALSNVSAVEIEDALSRTPIVSVQNMFNVGGGASALARNMHAVVDDPEGVLELCTTRGIAYMPYFPLGAGKVDAVHSALATIAEKRGVSSAQIALAWLLARSPMVLPIPGTRSIAHLEENWSARALALDEAELAALGVEAAAS
jgi:aryl-alcohol dehydrogenase-like predicted oxidoreductase